MSKAGLVSAHRSVGTSKVINGIKTKKKNKLVYRSNLSSVIIVLIWCKDRLKSINMQIFVVSFTIVFLSFTPTNNN